MFLALESLNTFLQVDNLQLLKFQKVLTLILLVSLALLLQLLGQLLVLRGLDPEGLRLEAEVLIELADLPGLGVPPDLPVSTGLLVLGQLGLIPGDVSRHLILGQVIQVGELLLLPLLLLSIGLLLAVVEVA